MWQTFSDLIMAYLDPIGVVVGEGVDVLHYFHAGPSVAAALVGAELANSCRVILYQHDHGSYLSFGPLKTL